LDSNWVLKEGERWNEYGFYLAGRIDYLQAFSNPKLTPAKESVDAMLIADGFGNLIVPIV
jgi:hypothetical protein